jgi:hypothetical protein
MTHLYDTAIANYLQERLKASGNPDYVDVKVYRPENIHELVALIKNDTVPLPVVSLVRTAEPVDRQRYNFAREKFGFPVRIDTEGNCNEVIYEYSIPIALEYSLQVMADRTWLADEIIRSLWACLRRRYFHELEAPYGIKRKISFGLECGDDIVSQTGSSEYHAVGTLYQKSVPLWTNGAVMLFSDKRKIMHLELDKIVEKLEDGTGAISPGDVPRLLNERKQLRYEN